MSYQIEKKCYIIAGEKSGDFIGAQIIRKLKHDFPNMQIYGVGGEQMLSGGLNKSLFPMEKISLFGLAEIIPHLFEVKKLINQTVLDIVRHSPDILITIDSPGFCLRAAEKVKTLAPQIYRMHIVAPSVWAYKPQRAIKMAEIYNHLLTLLPFEPPLFEKYGLKSNYIGHPIFEQTQNFSQEELDDFILTNKLTNNILTITPGSRIGEIKRHLPIFMKAVLSANFPEISCVILTANSQHIKLIAKIMNKYNVCYAITQNKTQAFAAAKVVLAKSGTNNLEIAAAGKPMLVCYKLNLITWWLIKPLLKIKYACLINILADAEIVPEFIQDKCSAHLIAEKLQELFENEQMRLSQVEKSQEIIKAIGFKSKQKPSQLASEIIKQVLIGKS